MDEINDDILNFSFDIEKMKDKLPDFSSIKLCEMIVCDRYFSIGENISIYCMEELACRRQKGDIFDFESYIDNSYKELPHLNLDLLDLRSVLNQIINKKIIK